MAEAPDGLTRVLLEQLLAESAEALLVARTDESGWPVVFANRAFDNLAGGSTALGRPLGSVIEAVAGRKLAREVEETVRTDRAATFPLEIGDRARLLVLKPLAAGEGDGRFCAAYWRGGTRGLVGRDREVQEALLSARQRIRKLSRDDPVTGLMNESAFRELLAHDWAVAARERTSLALLCFSLDDFEAYLEVFGRPATDSCLRRVGQAIRRCLRRASDVAARFPRQRFVVLSHASEEAGVQEFATRIVASVRDLRLHHPRSSTDRFVTVTPHAQVTPASGGKGEAERFLQRVLNA